MRAPPADCLFSPSCRFGKPIPIETLAKEFSSPDADSAKHAVKQLTRAIEESLVRLTINANDWEDVYAGRMARDLLWEDVRSLNLDEFVGVSQM